MGIQVRREERELRVGIVVDLFIFFHLYRDVSPTKVCTVLISFSDAMCSLILFAHLL